MKISEFRKKYYSPYFDIKQKTIDIIEDIVGELEDDTNLDFETIKGSIHYDVETLLEVMDKNLEDYKLLSEMCKDIETLEK